MPPEIALRLWRLWERASDQTSEGTSLAPTPVLRPGNLLMVSPHKLSRHVRTLNERRMPNSSLARVTSKVRLCLSLALWVALDFGYPSYNQNGDQGGGSGANTAIERQ